MKLHFHPEEPIPHLPCYETLPAEEASGTMTPQLFYIRVGGMGDGMDTRLINSLTYLWRRGTLGTTLSYLYSKKWNPLDLALGWGGKEEEEKENIKFKIFPFVHNF